ncbi:MAG TPA: NAD(P)H-binding protein [Actinomycetota bacterium]|nr:NAD(P)H-binding protein [Actinomycetota bacterium]
MRVAVTGGTGFVGGHLAVALSRAGHEVVLVARGVDRRPWAQEVLALPGVSQFRAGLDDAGRLGQAFTGCEAVAHCAGINREIGTATYQAVHVDGTRNAVRAAESAGVRRFSIVSFLRARPHPASAYHDSKWVAEDIVRSSDLEWTVLKPGMMYGRGDHMLDHLSKALSTFPIYVGVGNRRVRPLAIDDAVRVLEAALVGRRLTRQTVPIAGPTELSFDDAARLVARVIGKKRLFVRAPIAFHYLLARISEALMAVPLIARAQVKILEEELVEATNAPDPLPEDLAPAIPFDEDSIRRGLPDRVERFGRADFRRRAARG